MTYRDIPGPITAVMAEAEYQKCEGQPLPPARLAAILHTLPEKERLGFILSLDEAIADRVIEATTAPAQTGRREPNQ
jgi:hypothetical protein